jgi:sodium transport system permease protein
MRGRNIAVVYAKELRDMLRDRRTIISMIVVPVVILPALVIGLVSVATKVVGHARQEIPKVMLLGGTDSADTVAALRALPNIQFVPPGADYTNLISDKKIRAAVEIPPGFDAAVQNGESTSVRIYTYQGEMKSEMAAESLRQFFRRRSEAVVDRRLAGRHIDKKVLTPFAIQTTNVASPAKVSGNLVGMVLPYIIVLMCLTGTIYPAIDLTAGEKERGTMETLLSSPVGRTDLVLGKGLVVLTVSLATVMLSLASNGLALMGLKNVTGSVAQAAGLHIVIDPGTFCAVSAMMLPLAIFFSALNLAIGLFARGTKEANSYLQPLLLFAIIPAAAAGFPGIEMDYRMALIPIFNVSLACKEILAGSFHWNFMALVFLSMCAYAAVAVAAAVAMFHRENVLFRT